jgi:phosphoribosylformylglycinamidine synthase
MWEYLFAEEAGDIIEYEQAQETRILEVLGAHNIPYTVLGTTTKKGSVSLTYNGQYIHTIPTTKLRKWWQHLSMHLESDQMNKELAKKEFKYAYTSRNARPYKLTFEVNGVNRANLRKKNKPKVLMLREEGSNGDKEMQAMYMYAGFEVVNKPMSHFTSGKIKSLDEYQVLVLVGGFANADTFGAGVGWAGVLKFHPKIRKMFEKFRKRKDTLIFAVCNGCQMAAVADLIYPDKKGAVRLMPNDSGKFESRATRVKILPGSPCVWTKDMEGSELYIPSAHGEGKFTFKEGVLQYILENNLAPLRFIDNDGVITEDYPVNPNGSPGGIAGLTSVDGRVFIMMPHPERTWLIETDPWKEGYGEKVPIMGPLYKFATNAFDWCEERRKYRIRKAA